MNYGEIVAKARSQWIAEQRKHRHFLDGVEASVPWWLVIIAITLFALSAPHTARIFGMITPEGLTIGSISLSIGYLAPLLVEFGILYAEFESERTEGKLPWHIEWLKWLLWITAVLVNGLGSFLAVISTSHLDKVPAGEFVQELVKSPIIVFGGIVVALLSAFIIPIGTAVAGRGLALLILRRERQVDNMEAKWLRAAPKVLYFAFVNHLLSEGVDVLEARERATLLANSYLLSSPAKSSPVDSPKSPALPAPADKPERTPVQSVQVRLTKKDAAKAAFKSGKSVDEVVAAGIAGRSVAFDAWKDYRAELAERTNGSSNGHDRTTG